jgi:hypothetical protein
MADNPNFRENSQPVTRPTTPALQHNSNLPPGTYTRIPDGLQVIGGPTARPMAAPPVVSRVPPRAIGPIPIQHPSASQSISAAIKSQQKFSVL